MSLSIEKFTKVKPFDHIWCPICGHHDFTLLQPYGGVWCKECNAKFECRHTSGDRGCVVDCDCKYVSDFGGKNYRKALEQLTVWRQVCDGYSELPMFSFHIICCDGEPPAFWRWSMEDFVIAESHLKNQAPDFCHEREQLVGELQRRLYTGPVVTMAQLKQLQELEAQ